MYKEDLVLNNQQWLICHKTKPTKPTKHCEEPIENKPLCKIFSTSRTHKNVLHVQAVTKGNWWLPLQELDSTGCPISNFSFWIFSLIILHAICRDFQQNNTPFKSLTPLLSCYVVKSFCKISHHSGYSVLDSPNINLCNFWFFAKLKVPLKGRIYQTIEEIK